MTLIAMLLALLAPPPQPPAGTLVVLSDANRLTAIDVASRRRETRRVRTLPACGAELFVTGGQIVFSAVVKGRTTVFSIPLTLDRRPRRLGAAHVFVPSAVEGRIWLAGTDCHRTAMVGVREVSVEGEVTFDSDARVPGNWVAGAVPDGLVVFNERADFVWDPRTGRTAQASFDPDGVPSPDGSRLAVPVHAQRRWSVELVDARTGARTPIRGSATGRWFPELAWSEGGRLFIRDGFRVKAYRPGAARAERLPFRLPRTTIAFAAG